MRLIKHPLVLLAAAGALTAAPTAKAGPNVHLTPGMPASVAIVTGQRSILDYLLEPFTDSMRTALRER